MVIKSWIEGVKNEVREGIEFNTRNFTSKERKAALRMKIRKWFTSWKMGQWKGEFLHTVSFASNFVIIFSEPSEKDHESNESNVKRSVERKFVRIEGKWISQLSIILSWERKSLVQSSKSQNVKEVWRREECHLYLERKCMFEKGDFCLASENSSETWIEGISWKKHTKLREAYLESLNLPSKLPKNEKSHTVVLASILKM